jgi:CheY-like chemotaxis protein
MHLPDFDEWRPMNANALKLLLLEDDPVSRAFLHEVLTAAPATVDCAETCADAQSQAIANTHALWLFDANLPDGHGADLLRRLRALGLTTPAIALTAESARDRLELLLASGFSAVLPKPIAGNALLAAVRRFAPVMDRSTPADATSSALWDDAQALTAVGGKPETARALRQLFLDELPGQLAAIRNAFAASDQAAVRDQLHRLKASCGFVGAELLSASVNRLSAEMSPASFQAFQDVVALQLRAGDVTAVS